VRLHKEGYAIILGSLIICALLSTLIIYFGQTSFSSGVLIAFCSIPLLIQILIIQFFRVPKRIYSVENGDVLCPADGKVVVIEEVVETEYFNDRKIQISIFMSPLNVHANFNPVSGTIQYAKYHPGLFLVAWHPKVVLKMNAQPLLQKQKMATKYCFVKLQEHWRGESVITLKKDKKYMQVKNSDLLNLVQESIFSYHYMQK